MPDGVQWADVQESPAPDAFDPREECRDRLAESRRPVIGGPAPHVHVCREPAGHDRQELLMNRTFHECCACGLLWARP